jgi:hypothetical protein
MGIGIGSMIFNWVLFFLVNPNNIPPITDKTTDQEYLPPEVANTLPSALRYLSIMYLFIGCLGAYVMHLKEDNF